MSRVFEAVKAKRKSDWEKLAAQVNKLHAKLQKKPLSAKNGYFLDSGSILNAYREGDLTFDEACEALQRWKGLKSQASKLVSR